MEPTNGDEREPDMDITFYATAMQVVPLLLVALFLNARSADGGRSNARTQRWERSQDKLFTVLGVVAFMLSMLIVSGVLDDGRVTKAIVLMALGGSIGLLYARIWRRLGSDRPRPDASRPT